METQTSAPTPFPIMVLDDALDYDKDDFAAALKHQNDVTAFLSTDSSSQIVAKSDKKNNLLVRISKVPQKKMFRTSFVSLGESI